jgi:hypothetical protein
MFFFACFVALVFSQGPGAGISKSTWAATNTTVGKPQKIKVKSFFCSAYVQLVDEIFTCWSKLFFLIS